MMGLVVAVAWVCGYAIGHHVGRRREERKFWAAMAEVQRGHV